jgi:hypothetical protein
MAQEVHMATDKKSLTNVRMISDGGLCSHHRVQSSISFFIIGDFRIAFNQGKNSVGSAK